MRVYTNNVDLGLHRVEIWYIFEDSLRKNELISNFQSSVRKKTSNYFNYHPQIRTVYIYEFVYPYGIFINIRRRVTGNYEIVLFINSDTCYSSILVQTVSFRFWNYRIHWILTIICYSVGQTEWLWYFLSVHSINVIQCSWICHRHIS